MCWETLAPYIKFTQCILLLSDFVNVFYVTVSPTCYMIYFKLGIQPFTSLATYFLEYDISIFCVQYTYAFIVNYAVLQP